MADLDRTIVAWLRDGETVAPSRLADEIRLAVSAAHVPRRDLPRLPWTASRDQRPRALALVLAGAAVVTVVLGLLWASGSVAPPNPSPSIMPSPSGGPSATVRPSSLPPTPSLEATAGPVETYPPAATLSVPGVQLDLPAGWSWPPGGYETALIGALDQIGDPYAGVYNMLLHPVSSARGPHRFHVASFGIVADAGMHVLTSGIQESTPQLEADRVRATLEGAGYVVARSSVKLATGRAIVLDWDVAYNGPDLHYRAYVLEVGGAVQRIDFATVGPPSKPLATLFLDIVRSARSG